MRNGQEDAAGGRSYERDPLLPIRAFIPLTTEYRTLDDALAAVEKDYRESHDPGEVTFVVYRSTAGDAIVEVSRGGPFLTSGFYKIALLEPAE